LGGAKIEEKFNTRRRMTVRREKNKKNSAFSNKKWEVENNITNIADEFVIVKLAERR